MAPAKPAITIVDDGHQARILAIKFEHGSDVRLRDGWFVGSPPGRCTFREDGRRG